jgi:hypothetical protein
MPLAPHAPAWQAAAPANPVPSPEDFLFLIFFILNKI